MAAPRAGAPVRIPPMRRTKIVCTLGRAAQAQLTASKASGNLAVR